MRKRNVKRIFGIPDAWSGMVLSLLLESNFPFVKGTGTTSMRVILLVSLMCAIALSGCASSSKPTAMPNKSVRVKPKPAYIPESLESQESSQLMSVSGFSTAVSQGSLYKIDGYEVDSIKARKVFLSPGKHIFTYYTYISYSRSTSSSHSSTTMLIHEDGEFSGEAGKHYYWKEILKSINPQALPSKSSGSSGNLLEFKSRSW